MMITVTTIKETIQTKDKLKSRIAMIKEGQ